MKCSLSDSFLGILSAVALAAFAPNAVTAQTYDWKNVVIKGGGFVSGIVYHPTARDVLYARTDVGGAFRWQPATGSWLPITDHLGKDDSQLTGIVSFALDPRDANKVYLACGQYLPSWGQNAAILRSNDRGATWSRTDLALKLGGNSDGRSTGERLQVDPNQGSILFLGTNQDGLWKSTDSGQTWNKVTSFTPTSATLTLFDPRTGSSGSATQTIYVGVNSTSSASLYRSTDGGATWSAVPGIPSGVLPHHAKLSADGMLYVTFNNGLGPNGVTVGSVWKLKTADGTWTNVTPPTGQGGFAGLALDVLNPGTLVVTTLDRWSPRDEIYRSTDSGATWKALNALSTRDGSSAPYSNASSPHWLGAIEIDPFNAARAFYITGYGLFGTDNLTAADSNGNITWAFRNDGLEETVPLGIVSPPSGAPLVSVLGDIDGFRHDDLTVSPARGRHSVSVGTNNSIDFAELAPDKMVRSHGGGSVRASRSVDGGANWTYFASGPAAAITDAAGMIAISADAARIVWAPSRATTYVSADNGGSWTVSAGGPPAGANANYTPVSDRVNALKFYVYDSSNGRVYVSADGGSNFAQAASGLPTGGDPVRAVAGKEGHLWLTAWGGGLYRSVNSGASFVKVAGVQEGYRVGFGQAASGQSYPAIYLWGKIASVTGFFRSDDAGITWMRINDDTHQYGWINAITGDPRVFGRVYLATGGRGIIYGEFASSAPSFTIQPLSQTLTVGSSATFSAAAGGLPTPTYQWKKNTVNIAGAMGASLTLGNIQFADAGSYTVVATNGAGSVTSNAAILTVRVLSADFNGDAKPDLIWSNSITGERALWLMNGTNFLVASTLGIFPLEWTVAATGDFNGDGKPDIVWSNSITGERALWLMNGTNLLASSTLGIFPLEWTVAATGDFNGDGKPDIIWSNSITGERAIWLMNGTNFLASSTLGTFPLEWTVAATGDFNFDGKPDIIWSNSITGERAIWLMNGTNFLASSTLGTFPLEWTVAGTADFNGDGKPDIIWSNSITGERAIWLMNGTNFLASSTLGTFPLEWTVKN